MDLSDQRSGGSAAAMAIVILVQSYVLLWLTGTPTPALPPQQRALNHSQPVRSNPGRLNWRRFLVDKEERA